MTRIVSLCARFFTMVLYVPGIRNVCPDSWYIRCHYRFRLGKKLSLKDPKTFNEKLQWLKLNDRNPMYKGLVDKYEVRKYVEERVGREYLIPLVYDRAFDTPDDIDPDTLPKGFVIKCTHDSGSAVIVRDSSSADWEGIKRRLRKSMRRNYYWIGREWAYDGVKPRVIVEQLMSDDDSSDFRDYKIFCFNGEPRFIQVDFDRHTDHKRNIYSTDWEFMGFTSMYPMAPEIQIPRPPHLDRMLEIARALSEGILHVRVDLYNTGSKIYFGELTFYHGSGLEKYDPEEYDRIVGDMLDLSVCSSYRPERMDKQ